MESVNSYVEKEFKGNYVIGLQIRSEYLRGDYKKSFIDCCLQLEKEREPKDKRPIRWFLSSDSNTVLVDMQKAVLNVTNQTNKVVFVEGKTGHILQDKSLYSRILFDQEVLARTDTLVLSGGSTYGSIAWIKSGKLAGQHTITFHANSTAVKCEKLSLGRPGVTPYGSADFRR